MGAFSLPEKDTSVTGAYTFAIRPNLLNELRGGLSKFITERTFNANSNLVGEIGITGIPDLLSPEVAAAPNFVITGFTATGGTGASKTSSRTIQILDDLTWTKQNHTVKAGVDYRYLNAFAGNVFGSSRLGSTASTAARPWANRWVNRLLNFCLVIRIPPLFPMCWMRT